jgi:hypothetical protein
MGVKWLSRAVAYTGPALCLCTTQEIFDEACQAFDLPGGRFIDDESDGGTMHWYDGHSGPIAVVCIRPREKRDELIAFGMIVHEAAHVWQYHAEHIGEKVPGKEQEAYAIQAISQTLMIEYRRQWRAARRKATSHALYGDVT